MKISTKGRYGVRFLLDLAMHTDEGSVTLKEIARRQRISEKYLWQVVAPLKKAGLVRATAGSHGGYTLARPPADLTMKDILQTLEGDSLLGASSRSEANESIPDAVAREVWKELSDKIGEAMSSITLQDMMARQKEKQEDATIHYTI